ncbi:MAG: PHP domain-containing protein [Gemmataceae bacterium]
MPAGSPFTRLCQSLSAPPSRGRADLHLHTTASDGLYTPAQVVDLARRCGLPAIAITDHDTLAAIEPARRAAAGLEVIAGVEISCEFRERELHLLGYFFNPVDGPLNAALEDIASGRRERFQVMVNRLAERGVDVRGAVNAMAPAPALGRRHLAEILVKNRHAATVHEAFRRYLHDGGTVEAPKRRLPVEQAIALVRGAGGVAAWAHPPYDEARAQLRSLKDIGLGAIEVSFPSCRPGHVRLFREMAQALDLAVTGGSDCHGPEPLRRAVGSFGVSSEELARLRSRAETT